MSRQEERFIEGKNRMFNGVRTEEFLNKFLKDNPEYKEKCDRLTNYIQKDYKDEFKKFKSYLYNGESGWIMTDLSYELSRKKEIEKDKPYQDSYSYLRDIIDKNYNRLFHDIFKLVLSEEDMDYLKKNLSERTFDALIYSVEDFNKRKCCEKWVDELYLCHTWDINHHRRYDMLPFGDELDKIEEILSKYGFHRYEIEVDRKTVKDVFTTSF